MTENGPHLAAEQAKQLEQLGATAGEHVAQQCETPCGPRWKRVLKRIGIGIGVTVVVLVVLGVSLYEWGGMSGSVDPTMRGSTTRWSLRAKPSRSSRGSSSRSQAVRATAPTRSRPRSIACTA